MNTTHKHRIRATGLSGSPVWLRFWWVILGGIAILLRVVLGS